MKIVTIIGARPQFIKAAAVSRAITAMRGHDQISPEIGVVSPEAQNLEPRTLNIEHSILNEFLIHTGQHYDDGMSAVFFRELEIPEPKYNLAIGSGSHGAQTGQMLAAIEKVLVEEKPDWVLIYGDTNSTLAGALAAAKLHIPIAHVEAGLRSFNRHMPEEINRVVADQLSTLLLCPSQVAVDNLAAEGIGGNAMVRQAHHDTSSCPPREGVGGGSPSPDTSLLTPHVLITGDVMADALQFAATKASAQSDILGRLGLQPQRYILATVHRAENTDDPKRLSNIMAALAELAEREPVILPLHPRTRKILEATHPSLLIPHASQSTMVRPLDELRAGLAHQDTSSCPPREGLGGGSSSPNASHLTLLDPLGYFDIIALEKSARMLLTDSGGMQKEAYWLGVPCVTLRDETEWVETVESGWNILTGADRDRIITAVRTFKPPSDHPPLYGDGHATEKIIKALIMRS